MDVEVPAIWGLTQPVAGQSVGDVPSMLLSTLDNHIEATGVRFAWARHSVCPCAPINDVTQQPDLTCVLCRSHPGVIYFGPSASDPEHPYSIPTAGLPLTALQQALVDEDGSAVIRGVTSGIQTNDQLFSVYGHWQEGDCFISSASYNQLAYYDRLIALDSRRPYTEVSNWTVASGINIKTRYKPFAMNLVRSTTQIFKPNVDYLLSPTGQLSWVSGRAPLADTLVAVHYIYHPSWIVMDEPHADRMMQSRDVLPNLTEFGTPTHFPTRAHLRLEHLTNETRAWPQSTP